MTTKKRILFVDDDPHVLAGIRNVLFRDRVRWEMVFALGSDVALEHLATMSFDIIVSDMRMPGIDGLMLLQRVLECSPMTVRIMLSGTADKEEVDRAAATVDVLLGKPCDAATLRTTLDAARR